MSYKIENLSIVIPTLRESQNIKKLTEDIIKNINIINYEILFIDDNSKDGTEEILKELNEKNKNIKYIIRKEKKQDLSKSCILGFENSSYNNILVMDGDLQHDPQDINTLAKVYHSEGLDIVVGSRNLFHRKNEGLSLVRLKASQIIILITSILLGKKTNDPMSGFFIFKKEIYQTNKKKMFLKGYKILLDLIYSSNKKLKIVDVDINLRKRSVGTSKMSFKIIILIIILIIRKLFRKLNIFI
jgi:dolichol-phosphate mannosyltransferase